MIDEELTGRILKVFYKVYNSLGYGFIEGVYHNALILELVSQEIRVESEKPIAVYYGKNVVGMFSADLVVEDKVILELKAKESLNSAHEAQLLNYLRSTEIELGLLLNFGKKPEFKRKYFSNEKKHQATAATSNDTIPPNDSILRAVLEDDPPKSA
jgi:GxxExxY protein